MELKHDLTGKVINRLTVLKRVVDSGKVRATIWQCLCECGTLKNFRSGHLVKATTKSCGCLRRDMAKIKTRTHGLNKSSEHESWSGAKSRCLNISDKVYYRYGGRGITICDRWLSFENFYLDMGEKPSSKHSLDRIDNNGNYEPSNCRWATPTEQSRNRRSNRLLEFNGKKQCLSAWADELGISNKTIDTRYRRNYPIHKILEVVK